LVFQHDSITGWVGIVSKYGFYRIVDELWCGLTFEIKLIYAKTALRARTSCDSEERRSEWITKASKGGLAYDLKYQEQLSVTN
jgi:hypothetical protein